MSDRTAPSTTQVSRRIEFIDLLRGWAVIVMIETHVLNATLAKEVVDGNIFQWIKFMNGLVAPSFLFASGLAYAVTTRRKLSEYLSFGPPLFKQVRRLLFVVVIGYLLHLPKFNFTQILNESTERSWQIFFQADVLQCIGVSLLLIQMLLLLLKSERRLYSALIPVTLAIVLAAPVMWGVDFSLHLPFVVSGYLNGMHFPNFPGFPLFPWTAFLFAGAIVGYLYLQAKDAAKTSSSNNEMRLMKRVFWSALIIIGVSILIEPFLSTLYPVYDYWRFGPSFVFFRIGLVMILCAGMFYYEKKRTVSPNSPVTLIGRESLIVYSVHLLLIYGNLGTFNFQKTVNYSFRYGEALVATCVLVVLMYFLALGWGKLRKLPVWKRRIEYAVAAILVGVFFFGPGQ